MMERWIKIEDFENYEVSNFGKIRNKKGFIIKTQISNVGYELVGLSNKGVRRVLTVHRIVARAFILNNDNKEVVNHIDGNKLNNRSENLEWSTLKENSRHAFNSGLMENSKKKAAERMRLIGSKYGRSNILKTRNINAIKLLQKDLNGNLINEFESFRQMQKITGFDRKMVSIKVKQGSTYKGFLFQIIYNEK